MKKLIAFAVSLALLLAMAAHPLSGRAEGAPRPLANFNGDAYADLVIGVPDEDVSGAIDSGYVNVLYGTSAWLDDANNQGWSQDSTDVINTAEDDDQFGSRLAVGDFDGDGYMDLAVGVQYEDNAAVHDTGAVNILYGTAAGLTALNNEVFFQGSAGILDDFEADDCFGFALAVGDFDGDGYDDLAVGAPYEDIGSAIDAGAVNVLYGSATGLGGDNAFWHQDVTDVAGAAESDDSFGYALTAADFDGDGYSDLAVGVPYEDIGSVGDAGGVNILFGSTLGLIASRNQFWSQDDSGVSDTAEANDGFGRALTAADFDGDGYADLAVGVPYEDIGSPVIDGAGVVHILYGSPSGPATATGDQLWHQNVGSIMDAANADDNFGLVLTAGDFDGDGYADLGVGVPYEDTGGNLDSGAVNVIYGSGNGLTDVGDQEWWQDATGISDISEASDLFGRALAAGDFDGDGFDDLAVGVPYEDIGSPVIDGAGMVHVLYGTASGLVGGGMDQTWDQDTGTVAGGAEDGDNFGWALAALPHSAAQGIYLPLIIR
jgi:hypothetical protein